MKHVLPILIALGTSLLVGCAGTNQNSVAGSRLSDPYVSGQVNAHLDPTRRVQGSGSVETYQVLFVKFNAGGQESNVGSVGNRLQLKQNFPINPFELLVGSPADRQAALDEAYYNAVENGNCDALINTKVKLHTEGFSVLGLFGHGTASATVDGYGLNINKGLLPQMVAVPSGSRSILGRIFGVAQGETPASQKPEHKVAKKKVPETVAHASTVASSNQSSMIKGNDGTEYLASALPMTQRSTSSFSKNDSGY